MSLKGIIKTHHSVATNASHEYALYDTCAKGLLELSRSQPGESKLGDREIELKKRDGERE